MKRALRFIALFVLVVAAPVAIWQSWEQWRTGRDATETALAPQGKLPPEVTPTHYTVTLRIDPEQNHFSGSVTIDVDITRPLDVIWLHGKDIKARSAVLEHEDGTQTTLHYKEMGHSGIVRLIAAAPVAPQHARIHIRFDAPFSKKLDGLYLTEDEGRRYAFTQFEPVLARQAFPQFDEPRFKVPYDISLEIRQGHRGFGNTPVIKEESLADGFKRLTLATTPPMPSYLLAFAVGDLDVVEYADIPPSAVRDFPVPLRGIATKGKAQKLDYALRHTAALFNSLEAYFGIPYPFAKLDIVAVPDFAWGAMENVGLMTYRESIILLDDNPSVSQQRRLATVHAHEIAHQWLGNLVTMPWWDDIWLNESFATWIASRTVHQWNPALEVDRDILQGGHRVMDEDIYADSRSVREPVRNNEDIANVFDDISYSKGGAVLQMLESAVTPEVFRRGIQQYLRQHAWGTATAEDLMQALEHAAGDAQATKIAESYINQPGIPLITLDWRCHDGELAIDIEQQRYLPVGSAVSPDQEWVVPICLTLLSGDASGHRCDVLDRRQQRFTYPVQQCPGAVMPNYNGHGYYRFTLPRHKWRALLDHIGALSPGEKFSLANNLAAEYQAARIDTSFYLQAIAPVIAQPEWDVRTEPTAQVKQIWDMIATKEQQAQLSDYIYRQYKPLLDDLGLAPDTRADAEAPVATQLLRENALDLVAISLEQPELLANLAERGKALIGYGMDTGFNGDAIDRQLYALAMASAVITEGAPYFDALTGTALASNDANLRDDAFWALGQTSEPELSRKILDLRWLFNVGVTDTVTLIQSHISKMDNRQRAFDWFKRYYRAIAVMLPTPYLASTPELSGGLCSREDYDDAQAFFRPKLAQVEGMQRMLRQNLEKIHLCYSLVEAQRSSDWELATALIRADKHSGKRSQSEIGGNLQ
ncbi:MAG: M1 family metallopeptidase [Haliea sp.]|nr:M1 family metallopeptidase [Haliea sp.]